MNFVELFKMKQLPLLPKDKALTERDFKKIMKNLPNKNIFGDSCTEWSGVICNKDKPSKGQYINFYHSATKKKTTLHRVLYENFRDSKLREKDYLIHICGNKRCLCINHLIIKKDKDNIKKEEMYKIDFEVSF